MSPTCDLVSSQALFSEDMVLLLLEVVWDPPALLIMACPPVCLMLGGSGLTVEGGRPLSSVPGRCVRCLTSLQSASVVAVAHPRGGGMGLSVRKSRRDGFESRPGAWGAHREHFGSLKIQGRNFEVDYITTKPEG